MGCGMILKYLTFAAIIFLSHGKSIKRRQNVAYVADPVGNVLSKPSQTPAKVGSPVSLVRPDRYEFYTFDETGELIKRLMTLEEIQQIIATGEGDDGHLLTIAQTDLTKPASSLHVPIPSHVKVHTIVNNVQNVLKAEMEAQKANPSKPAIFDTPDVSNSWSLILPAIFGNTGGSITPDSLISTHIEPETDVINDALGMEKESVDSILPIKDLLDDDEEDVKSELPEILPTTENYVALTSKISPPELKIETKTTDKIDLHPIDDEEPEYKEITTQNTNQGQYTNHQRTTVKPTSVFTSNTVSSLKSEPLISVSSEDNKISTTTIKIPETTKIKVTSTTTEKIILQTTKEAPTSTTSKAPAPTTSKAPAPTTSKAPAPTTSKAPAPTTSKAPVPTTPKAPASTTFKTPTSTTTKKVSTKPQLSQQIQTQGNLKNTTIYNKLKPSSSNQKYTTPAVSPLYSSSRPSLQTTTESKTQNIIQAVHTTELPQINIDEIINKIAVDLQNTNVSSSQIVRETTTKFNIPSTTVAALPNKNKISVTINKPQEFRPSISSTPFSATKQQFSTTEKSTISDYEIDEKNSFVKIIPISKEPERKNISVPIKENYSNNKEILLNGETTEDSDYLELTTSMIEDFTEVTKPELAELSGSITDLISQIVDSSKATVLPLSELHKYSIASQDSTTIIPLETRKATEDIEITTKKNSEQFKFNTTLKPMENEEIKISLIEKPTPEEIVPTTYRPTFTKSSQSTPTKNTDSLLEKKTTLTILTDSLENTKVVNTTNEKILSSEKTTQPTEKLIHSTTQQSKLTDKDFVIIRISSTTETPMLQTTKIVSNEKPLYTTNKPNITEKNTSSHTPEKYQTIIETTESISKVDENASPSTSGIMIQTAENTTPTKRSTTERSTFSSSTISSSSEKYTESTNQQVKISETTQKPTLELQIIPEVTKTPLKTQEENEPLKISLNENFSNNNADIYSDYDLTTEGITQDDDLMDMLNQVSQIFQISPQMESKSDDAFEQNTPPKKETAYKKTDDILETSINQGLINKSSNIDKRTESDNSMIIVKHENVTSDKNKIKSDNLILSNTDNVKQVNNSNDKTNKPSKPGVIEKITKEEIVVDTKNHSNTEQKLTQDLMKQNFNNKSSEKLNKTIDVTTEQSIHSDIYTSSTSEKIIIENQTSDLTQKHVAIKNSADNANITVVNNDTPPNKTVENIVLSTPQTKAADSVSTNISLKLNKENEHLKKHNYTDNTWKLVSTVVSHNDSKSHTSINVATMPVKRIQYTKPPNSINDDIMKGSPQGLEKTTLRLGKDVLEFTKLCNELAFKYWKSVSSNGPDNKRSLVVSPFAVTSLLAMMFLGARGATSGEMNDILKLDDMVTFNPHIVFKNVTESIEVSKLSGVATSAFVRELYSDRSKGRLLSFYKDRVQQFYGGHVEEINFTVIGDIVRRRTNLLVKRQTWGKIPEYIKGNNMIIRAPLSIFSANIFQTDCTTASTEGRDGEMYFVVSPTIRQRRLVPVPAVLYKNGFLAGYDPDLDATVAALGTGDQITSTILVMPGQQGSTAQGDHILELQERLVESAIQNGTWSNLLKSLLPRPGLELQIPRFSHRSVENGAASLQKMGLKDLFTPEKADLRGLNGIANDLYVSDMLLANTFTTCGEGLIGEQHHVEVYPGEPNKAQRRLWRTQRPVIQEVFDSPITSDMWEEPRDYQRAFHDPLYDTSYLSMPLHLRPRQARLPDTQEHPRLKFDRPFMFFVRHNPTGLILYMGRYNPRLLP